MVMTGGWFIIVGSTWTTIFLSTAIDFFNQPQDKPDFLLKFCSRFPPQATGPWHAMAIWHPGHLGAWELWVLGWDHCGIGVLVARGTPSHHPFKDGIVHQINHPASGVPIIYGHPQMMLLVKICANGIWCVTVCKNREDLNYGIIFCVCVCFKNGKSSI